MQMTLEEKNNLTYGIIANSGCSGIITAIPRLNFPGLCLSDAGNGVRGTDFVNGYPSGIHVGASWSKDLAKARAVAMGGEFKTKGVNVALGPVVGPLGRVAEGGRNWEGFSNDPYLCGALAAETVMGIQSAGVITSTKHYIGNEQETNRNPSTSGDDTIASVSSNIDDKTLHELYLWPFADAVHAGSGSIMCSYNRVNNSYSCGNSKMLNGLLKTELGFQGFVVSDWIAQHSGVGTALAGLDMTMPVPLGFWGDSLLEAVTNGSVPESRLDDMATRIIAAWYQMNQDSGFPARGVGMPEDLSQQHPIINAKQASSNSVLLNGAIEGHVLVKNINNSLPLQHPQLLSLFGYDGQDQPTLDGIYSYSFDGSTSEDLDSYMRPIRNQTVFVGGGSGANSPSYVISPFDALKQRAVEDGTSLYWDFLNSGDTGVVNAVSDACLVFINAWATEGSDRPGLNDTWSDDLVNNVAATCSNTIVVIHNAGVRLVDAFAENPNVTAIIFAHLPGQDSGRALVSILYGLESPSGKLPYTVAKSESDYGSQLAPSQPEGEFGLFPQSDFEEGVYIDYRAFDSAEVTPRYEFGFGLSYTTFEYSNLQIPDCSSHAPYATGALRQGGTADLWDNLVIISADVKNSGSVAGAEVAQLYVGIPNGPVRQLRGFSKVLIQPGETETVTFPLTRRDLSEWDVVAQAWKLQSGDYKIFVGASSRILPLVGSLTI